MEIGTRIEVWNLPQNISPIVGAQKIFNIVRKLINPLEGESFLKKSVIGGNIVLEARTNKDLIQNIDYNISARLFSNTIPVVLGDFNNDFNLDFDGGI